MSIRDIDQLEDEVLTLAGDLTEALEQRDSARSVAVKLEQENARLMARLAVHSIVATNAQRVMDALEEYGPSIVGHLLDTDDNSGQYLRTALAALAAGGVA